MLHTMLEQRDQLTKAPYRSPAVSVVPCVFDRAFCQSSGNDPDPGGGEGFGDPYFV